MSLIAIKRMTLTMGFILGIGLLTFGLQMIFLAANQSVSRQAIGQKLLDEDQPLQAALVFDDPAWQGVAHFQAARYRQAAGLFQSLQGAQATYNYGVAIARLRRWDDAIAAFRVVLDEFPDDPDARFNYELLQKISTEQAQRERRHEGADQGGELKEDTQAPTDDPQQSSGSRPENEPVAADPGDGSQAPRAQGEEPDTTEGQSGQDAEGRRSQAMSNPPTEPDNPSLANLGGNAPDTNQMNPADQEMLNAQRHRSAESSRIDAMRMRRLNDNAALVLEARFRAVANSRGAGQQ